MTARQAVLLLVLIFCSVDFTVQFDFLPSGNSSCHCDITQTAILRKTAEVCRDIAASERRNFTLNIDNSLSVDAVQRACSPASSSTSPISSANFQSSISSIILQNGKVDFDFAQSEYHFHNEAFQRGRDIITAGVQSVKERVRAENYDNGRRTLGQVLHVLQDFYSHSNWVELGNKAPYGALIRPDEPLTNLAGPSIPTCRNCTGDDCTNNLLQQNLLTSGYFSISSSAKPPGKCSHGGPFDQTSKQDPVGGISKDNFGSSHGFLHEEAAALALDATMELLEDIRLFVGDRIFLRFMGLSQSNVLCFAIDTTGSMSDDITEARLVTRQIINSRRGTPQEPSAYILVPFNDPGFGPVTMTTNADVFTASLDRLTANGGGDLPELALSGLQLALTEAPPSSEIFVFTDAPAKDTQLQGTVTALIESTKSVVNFLFTGSSDNQLFQDLAQASGGQFIRVGKLQLFRVINIVDDSSTSGVVTVFQVVRDPGSPATFRFDVDGSLTSMIVYITGASSLTFSLTSSTGVSQSSSQVTGPLGIFGTTGNFRRLSLNIGNQIGLWNISISSNEPYSVRVTGRSSLSFVYNLVEEEDGAHGDFVLKEGRISGGNASALIFLTGSVTTRITEVSLVDISGSTQVIGSSKSVGCNAHLATFTDIPNGEFAILLKGEDSSSLTRAASSSFQRQGTTQLRTSTFSVTSQPNIAITEPESSISIPFTVTISPREVNDSVNTTFAVRANNDRGYASTSPSMITVEASSGGKANGTVMLTVPASAASGTDVTLTIEAQKEASTDINFMVNRFAVSNEVTDITPPTFQNVQIPINCSTSLSLCASSQWELTANVTDGINGSGIARVSVRQGNGSLIYNTVVGAGGVDILMATYRSSCCAQRVELIAVDKVGNVRTRVEDLNQSSTAAPITTPVTTDVPTTVKTIETAAVTTADPVTTTVTTPAPVPGSVTTPAPVSTSVTTAAPSTINTLLTPPPQTTAAPATTSATTTSSGPRPFGLNLMMTRQFTNVSNRTREDVMMTRRFTNVTTREDSFMLTGVAQSPTTITVNTTASVTVTLNTTVWPTVTFSTCANFYTINCSVDPLSNISTTIITVLPFTTVAVVTINTSQTTDIPFTITSSESSSKINFTISQFCCSHTTTVHIRMIFTITVITAISLLQVKL